MEVNYNSESYENARIKYYNILASSKRFKKNGLRWSEDDKEMLKVLIYSPVSDYQMEKHFERERHILKRKKRELALERLSELYKQHAKYHLEHRLKELAEIKQEIAFLKKELNL